MYIMCFTLSLFSVLSRKVGALQISNIIIIIMCLLLGLFISLLFTHTIYDLVHGFTRENLHMFCISPLK